MAQRMKTNNKTFCHGQSILEFTFTMVVISLILMGMLQTFVWQSNDMARRRQAHAAPASHVPPRRSRRRREFGDHWKDRMIGESRHRTPNTPRPRSTSLPARWFETSCARPLAIGVGCSCGFPPRNLRIFESPRWKSQKKRPPGFDTRGAASIEMWTCPTETARTIAARIPKAIPARSKSGVVAPGSSLAR